jgi:hypothetical protein
MADIKPVVTSDWKVSTFVEFEAVNPHLNNHSSRTVLDPEVPVAQEPAGTPS